MIAVPLPRQCCCGGALAVEKIVSQFQHEIIARRSGGASTLPSGAARYATNESRDAIRGRPPTP